MRRLTGWRVSLLILIGLLGSCTGVSRGGPLDQDNPGGEVCVPATSGGAATIGGDILENGSGDTLIIEEVTLPSSATNLRLLEARIGRAQGDLIGAALGYPPEDLSSDQQALWDASTPALGAQIPPNATGDLAWNLIVGLALDDREHDGETDGIEVRYTTDEQAFLYTTPFAISLRESCF